MSVRNARQKRRVVIGIAGVFALLATSLAVALWKSSEPYQADQIHRIVGEQQAIADTAGQ